MRQRAIPCWQFRGGSSKGFYFKASDLPADETLRNQVILHAVSGATGADKRQVDGLGGAHPLTSKVAVVGPSTHPDADIDYLFVQLSNNSEIGGIYQLNSIFQEMKRN